jgi:CxxC motif-containing protein
MAEETTKLICITCPVGCALDVTHDGETILNVDGNTCNRGIDYAKQELTDPRRMVTTTVRVKGGLHPLLPVYTSAPIPKPRVFDLLREIRQVEVEAPVKMGQVILSNVVETDVNVLASRDMPAVG